MNYKGAYDGSESYSVGDVVVYTDNVPYILFAAASAGTTPHDVHYWRRVEQPFSEVVTMFHATLGTIPNNLSSDVLTLSTETADYLITVDDSGDTPELVVTADDSQGGGT